MVSLLALTLCFVGCAEAEAPLSPNALQNSGESRLDTPPTDDDDDDNALPAATSTLNLSESKL